MHEIGVVLSVVATIEEIARNNNAEVVKKLVVQIGELSTVLPQYFEPFFNAVKEDHEMLKNCELEIERFPALIFCRGCGESFEPGEELRTQCPHCSSEDISVICGQDMVIKEIAI